MKALKDDEHAAMLRKWEMMMSQVQASHREERDEISSQKEKAESKLRLGHEEEKAEIFTE